MALITTSPRGENLLMKDERTHIRIRCSLIEQVTQTQRSNPDYAGDCGYVAVSVWQSGQPNSHYVVP